jgi:hypothetical protein
MNGEKMNVITPSHGLIRRMMPLLVIVLLVVIGFSPATAAPLTSNRHIFFNVANDAGVKYNVDGSAYGGPSNTYYIKADGGGLNELHITNDASSSAVNGQPTTTSAQSGTFYVTNTGGRGFDDTIVLLLSVQDPIPDDFAVHIKSSGYTWTPSSVKNQAPTTYTYLTGAVDETFTKADFIYGPQNWKAGPGSTGLPLFVGQDLTDLSTNSHLMFVDLKVGNLKGANFAGVTDYGASKVEYTFTNLDTSAAFNGYGWCLNANQGQGISWTNNMVDPGASGYYVTGVERPTPAPEFPTMALPAALIVGMLGVVLFVRRTKEN